MKHKKIKTVAKKMKGAYYDKKSKEVKGLGAFNRRLQQQRMKDWPRGTDKTAAESFKRGMGQSAFGNLPPGYREEE